MTDKLKKSRKVEKHKHANITHKLIVRTNKRAMMKPNGGILGVDVGEQWVGHTRSVCAQEAAAGR